MKKLRAVGTKVLVSRRRRDQERVSTGGIILPTEVQEDRTMTGEVRSVGGRVTATLEEGSQVLFTWSPSHEQNELTDGPDSVIYSLEESEIVAVLG